MPRTSHDKFKLITLCHLMNMQLVELWCLSICACSRIIYDKYGRSYAHHCLMCGSRICLWCIISYFIFKWGWRFNVDDLFVIILWNICDTAYIPIIDIMLFYKYISDTRIFKQKHDTDVFSNLYIHFCFNCVLTCSQSLIWVLLHFYYP